MSWLTRFTVDKEDAFRMKAYDSYAFHRRLWECFPGLPEARRKELGFLTRIDEEERAYILWLLSKCEQVRPAWCDTRSFAVKEIAATYLSHRYYAFDLRANPVRTLPLRDEVCSPILRSNGRHSKGKRVPIVDMDELRAWLLRKAQVRSYDADGKEVPGGFRIVQDTPVEIHPMTEVHFRKNEREAAYHGGVRFRGVLEVTDRDSFVDTYHCGIGPAKCFGFGLLLLSPIIHHIESKGVHS
jgi:CRISPR system Cascade subunit CasE